MFVKPAEGLAIRDPDLMDLLPPAGRQVPDSGYWMRRLADGDVVETTPAEPPSEPLASGAAAEAEPEQPQAPAPTNKATDKGKS